MDENYTQFTIDFNHRIADNAAIANTARFPIDMERQSGKQTDGYSICNCPIGLLSSTDLCVWLWLWQAISNPSYDGQYKLIINFCVDNISVYRFECSAHAQMIYLYFVGVLVCCE